MHIIITGGTGLIGQALTKSLLADGHRVTILTRSPEKPRPQLDGATLVRWDGRTADGWGHLADGAGAIVNLAGAGVAEKRWTAARKSLIHDSRLHAGQAVMTAISATAQKPPVLIQSSAVGYYGENTDDTPLTETAPPDSDFLAQVCVEWEAATAVAESLGVRRAVIRTGVVLATEGGALPRMALPFRFFVGGCIGSGKQWIPWIHIADEIAAIRFLLENDSARGAFNLTAPNPVTNTEFSRELARALHRPALFPVPPVALKLAFGELASVLLGGQRAVPAKLQSLGFKFQFPDIAAALQNLV